MHPYHVLGLERGVAAMARVISLIPTDKLDEAIEPGRFTPREVVAHMADWEPIFRNRIELALEQPGVLIEVFDEEQMAIDHDYAHADLALWMAKFRAERERTVLLVRSLKDSDRLIGYRHPEFGEMRVQDQIDMFLGHDLYHLEQLTASL